MTRYGAMMAAAVVGMGLVAALGGCASADKQKAYPMYAPSVAMVEADAAIAKHRTAMPEKGVLAPVGIRSYGDTVIVVDVLVAVPKTLAPTHSRQAVFQSIYNALEVFEAADQRGFGLRRADGVVVALRGFDLSKPPSGTARMRYSLVPGLEARSTPVTVQGQEFDAAVLPIIVRCAEPIAPGSQLCVRLEGEGPYGGLTVVREEYCGTVRAMPASLRP